MINATEYKILATYLEEVKVEIARRRAETDDALAAKDAEIKRLREALKQCKTHIAGFNIRSHEDARSALSESNNELQRIHRVARAALEATPTERPAEKQSIPNFPCDDPDYYKADESGYSRADEEWFFDMDGKP